jgi:hypothetical protein
VVSLLSKAGWSWGRVSAIDSNGRTILVFGRAARDKKWSGALEAPTAARGDLIAKGVRRPPRGYPRLATRAAPLAELARLAPLTHRVRARGSVACVGSSEMNETLKRRALSRCSGRMR